jgi:hypothetical protein
MAQRMQTHRLGARVRTRPAYRDPAWPSDWHPAPWRVIGRMLRELRGEAPYRQYLVEPWVLSGVWQQDRPVWVHEQDVAKWGGEWR